MTGPKLSTDELILTRDLTKSRDSAILAQETQPFSLSLLHVIRCDKVTKIRERRENQFYFILIFLKASILFCLIIANNLKNFKF